MATASELFTFNFKVYRTNSLSEYCLCAHFYEFPTIYLEYVNGNHFNLLFGKDNGAFSLRHNLKRRNIKDY